MNEHIKGLLALAFRTPEDSEPFAALLSQIDGSDRGVHDVQSENLDSGHRDEADRPAGLRNP
jgi:hypothetical protein